MRIKQIIRQAKIWKFFCSIKLAMWLLAVIVLFSLVGTLIPQNKEQAQYISRYGHSTYHLFLKTGLTNIYSAWWFILSLVLLFLNLTACVLNRFSLKACSLGTLTVHISILLILAGALVGMLWGEKGYIRIKEGEIISSFKPTPRKRSEHHKQGQCPAPTSLGFSLRLDDFIDGKSTNIDEKLLVYSGAKPAYGTRGKLISAITVQIGKELKIAKTGYTVQVLRYVPDFVMDTNTKEITSKSTKPVNPALELEIKGKNSLRKFWVFAFADYPDTHGKTKENFKIRYYRGGGQSKGCTSKVTVVQKGKEVLKADIRVNYPLKFEGYTFFQSNGDKENFIWSGLQIVKDPGVPIVYAGFSLLILGLIIIFYINPMITRRK